MDVLLEFVNTLAWPITVIILALLFRSELRGVFRRLSHLKYRDLEAKFEKGLREVEENARGILATTDMPQIRPQPHEYDRIIGLVEISPRAAITEAWREVELATAQAAAAAGIDVEGRIAGTRHIQQLVQRELAPPTIIPVYNQLRRLRNRAAHGAEFEVDTAEAERFADLALGIAVELNRIADNLT